MRRRGAGIVASPTMVGALTVMVVILAVFLAYNANNGLPFVPAYRVTAQVRNADTLVPGNEVRVGGVRVGQVESIEPQADADGDLSARLNLKLEKDVDPIPVDSTVIVRSRSALGLKYLEINMGNSDKGYPEGSTMPLSAATPEPVEIDTVLGMFDEPTRAAIQENLVEFGDAVAGRGPAINSALGRLPGVLELLRPVMHEPRLAEPGLARFITALGRDGGGGGAGRRDPGAGVRLAGHHVHRARRGRPAVHPGVDLRGPADRGGRDQDPAADPRPARELDRAVPRPGAGGGGAADGLAGDRARRSRPARRSSPAPTSSTKQLAADLRIALRAQQRRRRRAGISAATDGDRHARAGDQVHHARPDRLQLRRAR